MTDEEIQLYSETNVVMRRGDILLRNAGPHSQAVHALLRHLEEAGFDGSPRVVDTGFDDNGRETLTYIEGTLVHPCQRSAQATFELGEVLRSLHSATATFVSPPHAQWRHRFFRHLGDGHVVSHCDPSPWNVCLRDGLLPALIDWDLAGPIDPLVELAHAAWLNAGLYSDDIPEAAELPPLRDRAAMVRALLDGYGLARSERRGFVDKIASYAIHSTAAEADEHAVARETTASPALWGMTWQSRSAAWILRNQSSIERYLT